ncbi:hypothetical protein F0562_004257 [Nyssa sinensis]|uniref:F-box protein At3g26010-like beta-propeller domain-containing protein n=1 Tax=Nyssa sinensis TaxID=561372 RepID=A0A5J5BY11_9ASTE|nr:hypothetical protein F0562_004257 [Nyssa sinensis]
MYTHRFSAAPSYHMRFDNFLRSSADDYQFPSISVMFPPGLPREDFCISASSNGFLLCRWQKEVYFVANPLTRRRVSLPRHTRRFPEVSEGFVTKLDEYEIAVTNFKVVRLDGLSHASYFFSVEIFSSETGEWTDSVLQCPLPIQLLESGGPIVYNGIPHWPTRRNRMVAYDPFCDNNPCRLLKLPEDRDTETEAVEDAQRLRNRRVVSRAKN